MLAPIRQGHIYLTTKWSFSFSPPPNAEKVAGISLGTPSTRQYTTIHSLLVGESLIFFQAAFFLSARPQLSPRARFEANTSELFGKVKVLLNSSKRLPDGRIPA